MNAQAILLTPEAEQAVVDDEHPWPGLASFREQDEDFFKGRGHDIEELQSLVERERLTVLFGVSGLGKSSLLQAGLFPRLRLSNILPVYVRLDFGESSLSLSEQVFAALARQVQEKAIEVPLHNEQETLWAYFHRKDIEFWDVRNRMVVPLLCFDQFEEIFTLGYEDPRRRSHLKKFITELADLVEGRCPESVKARLDANPDEAKNFNFSRHSYKVIFSLREDYHPHLEGLRGWMPSVIHNRMRLLHMNGEQALAVANQTRGRLMQPDIAETVVRLVAGKQGEDRELSGVRIEPALLSLVCRELNERRIANRASQIDAQSVASNREQILENFYVRALDDQSPELRHFIEDKLITVSGFRNSEAYDNAVGVPGITAEALDRLVQRRLLRLEERDGVKRIELIHDVMTGVVRKSRDQRLLVEKQKQAEQERREAEQREQTTREALRVSRRRTWVFGILTGIALLSSALGWWSWSEAQESNRKAQESAKEAEKSSKKAKSALAGADFREAQRHYNENNVPFALPYLAHAVRLDPHSVANRTLLVNLLQQRSWFLPVAIFELQATLQSAFLSPDGTQVLTASGNIARLWDRNTGLPFGEAMTHKEAVGFAQFSPDGTRVLTVSEDNTVRLWDGNTGRPFGEAMTHKEAVGFAQFSPDGNRVLTVSEDNTVRLWEADSGNSLGEAMRHQATVRSAQFSPDGTRVLTTSWNRVRPGAITERVPTVGAARLWDAKTGEPLGEAMMDKERIESAQFSPDGTRVLTISGNTARLWDAKTGKTLTEAMMHEKDVQSAQFSPDGTWILSASGNTAWLWDAKTGKTLAEAMMHEKDVQSAQFSPDGTRVLTTSGNTAWLWDAKTGKTLAEAMMHEKDVQSAQFSPDGTRVLTASGNCVRLWNANTGQPLGEAMRHETHVVAEFSSDGTQVLTGSGNIVRVWEARAGKGLSVTMMHRVEVSYAWFSPDGTRVLTLSQGNTALLWDAKTGQPLGEAMEPKEEIRSVQYSPDGTRVLTAPYGKTARLWDAKTGQPMGEMMTHREDVSTAQFSPDGTRVLTTSYDNTARLWNAKTGELLGEAMEHKEQIRSAQFSPDGTWFLTISGNAVRLWDAKTGQPFGEAMEHKEEVESAQFSPDGTSVLTASGNAVRLWDAKTGKPLGKTIQHKEKVQSAQFSPDGTSVLTTSGNLAEVTISYARLWDAKTGQPLGEAMTHADVPSAEFSPDGMRVLTVSGHIARLWDAKTGQPLGEAMEHKEEVRSVGFSPDSTRVLTTSGNGAWLWDAKNGKPLSDKMAHQGDIQSAQFSSDGARVVTASNDKTARLWDVSPVASHDRQLLPALAEAVSGSTLSELGAVEALEDQVSQLNKLRQQTASSPLGAPTSESFIRWFLSDPWTRTVSPLSRLTVPEYIQQEIAAGRRDEMEQEFPGHPLLLP